MAKHIITIVSPLPLAYIESIKAAFSTLKISDGYIN